MSHSRPPAPGTPRGGDNPKENNAGSQSAAPAVLHHHLLSAQTSSALLLVLTCFAPDGWSHFSALPLGLVPIWGYVMVWTRMKPQFPIWVQVWAWLRGP